MAAQLIRAEEALFILEFFPFLIVLTESQESWIIFAGIKERFVSETVDFDFEIKFVGLMDFYPSYTLPIFIKVLWKRSSRFATCT